MVLHKLSDFDPDYKESFNGKDLHGRGVYTETDQKIGSVHDVLVDEEGHFRYFIVDLGFWIFGKKVLLPVGRSRVDENADRIYVVGMTREQAEDLPEFNENTALDYDYEERVRGVYRNPVTQTVTGGAASAAAIGTVPPVTPIDAATTPTPVNTGAPLEASAPLDAAYTASLGQPTVGQPGYIADETSAPEGVGYHPGTDQLDYTTYNRDTYNYQHEPSLYGLNDRDHQTLKLYEERLIANKKRVKTGEVAIGKHVETETARVAVPIEKERVVVERVTPPDAGRAVTPGTVDFREGEVARVELYEETPDIRKEAVLREEVRVNKVVEQDTVSAQDTIRREELDIQKDGTPIVEGSEQLGTNQIPKDRL
ncbi:MAG: DUF2382 domain-containing protein [Chroococcidiopsidaceae cyanobacterium CP_BM_ER_R8_30]|nr:DUF2382 domain-containing protein [Chroococcidiopsidaceae cyanobacterium CP_BM_ER_R8_30]